MTSLTVISGHPDLANSHTNRVILDRLADAFPGSDIRRLDSLYPDYRVDASAEQAALMNADTLVLQFPFYWYSVPGLLKTWMDTVLSYGFAYGSEGDKLHGKALIVSVTVGGPETSYQADGYNHFPMEDLLKPLRQMAYLTGLDWQPPIISHGMVFIPGVYNTLEQVTERAHNHAGRLIESVKHSLTRSAAPA